MGYVRAPGNGIWIPEYWAVSPGLSPNVGIIDATGEKLAIVGRVRWANNAATKNIRRVQLRWGTVVKAGGSGLTISLQDVTLTTGPAAQPDGTPDQTVAVSNGDAAFASDTWYRSGVLSADRAAAHASLLAVVIEFDGSGRLSSDSVRLSGDNSTGALGAHGSGFVQNTGSWATSALAFAPNIILEADDGTIGTLEFSKPFSAVAATAAYNSASTPDEIGNAFTLPFNCKVDAISALIVVASGANFDLCLYRGTTLVASAAIDGNTTGGNNSLRPCLGTFDDVEIEKDVEHFITVKPTGANNVTLQELTVNDAAHWDVHPGGQAMCLASRTDAGSFSKTAAKRILMGIRISQFIDVEEIIGGDTLVTGMVG